MTAANTGSVESSSVRVSFDFVHSRPFDWCFFLAPFWASILYLVLIETFPAHEVLIFILSYILLAETHFASTWTIYLDPENRKEYSAHTGIYYYVPLLIMVGFLLVASA